MESKLDSMEDLSKVRARLKSLKEAPGSSVVDGESCGVAAVCVIMGTTVLSLAAPPASIFDSCFNTVFKMLDKLNGLKIRLTFEYRV